MQDEDLYALKNEIDVPLNLEMAATPEMIELALATAPDMAMIVPEGRQEVTTEGGLDVQADMGHLSWVVETLGSNDIPVSAFVDPDESQITAAKGCGFRVCEIHTGAYAQQVIACNFDLNHSKVISELEKIMRAVSFVLENEMQCNAGHGLTHHNVCGIASIPKISELHIGHSIVSRSVFVGMQQSVREMKERMQKEQT